MKASTIAFKENDLHRKSVLKIHEAALKLKKSRNIGHRNITRIISKKYGFCVSENTVAGWIYQGLVPYANTKTQFQPKPMPSQKELKSSYLEEGLSATATGKRFRVSFSTAKGWLRKYGIQTRNHLESMRAPSLRKILSEQKIKKPTKNFRKLVPEKAYILGVLAGDGYIGQKALKLEIKNDVEFVKEFVSCLKKVYGFSYKHRLSTRGTYVVDASSVVICQDLSHYGDFRTQTWKAPSMILKTKNKRVIAAYLRGLYDSEGSVGDYTVAFFSDSQKGIQDVKTLLYRLGVSARLYKTKDDHYRLIIMRRYNLQRFKEMVGFTIRRKMEKLETRLDAYQYGKKNSQ